MNCIIFIISVIGIFSICYVVNNYGIIINQKRCKEDVKITLKINNVDYVERKEIISKIMCGNYENLLDIVDNIQIN